MENQKNNKVVISITCSIMCLILSSWGLIISLQSIGAPGLEGLGVIFIMPSVIAVLTIVFDLLITLDKIKKGLIYSWVSSVIKIGIIVCFVSTAIRDYKYEMKYGMSPNLGSDIFIIVVLTIFAIPSILNVIKLTKSKTKQLQ